jgi:hypothetical protein
LNPAGFVSSFFHGNECLFREAFPFLGLSVFIP